METEHELGIRIGRRLSEIRREAGLSQAEVAQRMGMKDSYGKQRVWMLESGHNGCPSVRTIGLYLRACGARWSRLSDILDQVEPVKTDSAPIRQSGLDAEAQEELARRTQGQADRYLSRLAFPTRKPALRPARQAEIAARLGRYRAIVNTIELTVADYLKDKPIPRIDYMKYRSVARQALGELWRNERRKLKAPKAQGKRPKTAGSERYAANWQKLGVDPELAEQVRKIVAEKYEQIAGSGQGNPSAEILVTNQ
jgi:transcriptional regulator with XRE-family HTH domain